MGEQFYFIFYALVNGLTNLFAFTSFLVVPLKKTQKIIFVLSGSIIYYLYMSPLQIIPSRLVVIFLIGTNLLLVFLFQKNSFLNLICALSNHLFSSIINGLVLIILGHLGFGIDWITETTQREFIFLVLRVLWLYGINSLLGRFIRHIYFHKPTSLLENISYKKYSVILFWSLLLIISFFVFNLTYVLMADYPTSLQIYNFVSFSLLFVILGITVFLLLKSIRKEHLIKLAEAEQSALRDYTDKLELLYRETRAFRHDYINILSTMNGYFVSRDYEGLENYFKKKLSLLDTESSLQNATLGKLTYIHVPELKGLLYYKLFMSLQAKLWVTVDIRTYIDTIPMDIIDFIRTLGILLDNAIEASTETAEKYFSIGIEKSEGGLSICVENSCHAIDNIECLFQQGYSTKGTNRGIGLWEVRNLLKFHPNVSLNTYYHDNHFLQELEIAYEERT